MSAGPFSNSLHHSVMCHTRIIPPSYISINWQSISMRETYYQHKQIHPTNFFMGPSFQTYCNCTSVYSLYSIRLTDWLTDPGTIRCMLPLPQEPPCTKKNTWLTWNLQQREPYVLNMPCSCTIKVRYNITVPSTVLEINTQILVMQNSMFIQTVYMQAEQY